jgi:hypothetical protein
LLVVAAVLGAAGLLWDAVLFRESEPSSERTLAFLVLSFASWIAISFALCALHLLTRPWIGALAALSVIAAIVATLLRRRRPRILPPLAVDGWAWALVAAIAAVEAALYLVALNPIPAWDADVYHLTVPRLFDEAGGFRRIPFNVYSTWPLATELLYALVMPFSDHIGATLVHFLFGLATCVLLGLAAKRALPGRGAWVALLAIAFFWMNPVVQLEYTFAYADLTAAFFFLAGFLVTGWGVEPDAPRTNLLVAGVALGMLAGAKPNGIISVAVIQLLAIFWLARNEEARSRWKAWVAGSVVPSFLLAIVWPIKSWLATGNPFYPFLFDRLGGPEWSSSATAQFEAWQASIGMGRTFGDDLLLPIRVILMGDYDYQHFYGVMNRAWLALVPLAIVLGWRNSLARSCLAACGLSFVFWAATSQQMRFLVPVLALLSLATAIALVDAANRLSQTRIPFAILGLGAAVLLMASTQGIFRSAREWGTAYLQKGSQLPRSAIKPIYTYVDRRLPPDARLLLVNTNFGYFVARDFIADSFFEASQIADWLGVTSPADIIHQRILTAGVTHLLVADRPSGAAYPPALLRMINEGQGLARVYRDEKYGFNLLRVCRTLTCDDYERGKAKSAIR